MHADYVLTTFSPAMFGEAATAHIKIVPREEAQSLVDERTCLIATRPTHERLARNQLVGASGTTGRFAMLKPGICAVHLHYRGPAIGDDGELPVGGMCTFFLIEVEDYEAALLE